MKLQIAAFLFCFLLLAAAVNPPLRASSDGTYAIEGNCPVALVEAGKAVPGYSQYTAEYKGKVYRFPGAQAKAMFLRNPEKYTADLEAKYQRLKK